MGSLLRTRPLYFLFILVFPSIVALSNAWVPEPVFKGQGLGILVGLLLICVSVLFWFLYRSKSSWSNTAKFLLFLSLALWVWEMIRIVQDNSGFNYLVVSLPIFILLVALRRPDCESGPVFFAVLGIGIVGVAIIGYVSGELGWMVSGFIGPEGGIATRYPWLEFLLGAETRWIGPFSSVNFTAAAGGLAVVAGLASQGVARWICIFGGVLTLLLSQGDAATFAVAIATLVFIFWSPWGSRTKWLATVRVPVTIIVVVIAVVVVTVTDGAFDVRLTVWSNFIGLWSQSPIIGIGTSGVYDFINNQTARDFVPYTHAHSVLLNGAVLYGAVWGLLLLFILVSILVLAWKATKTVGSGPLAVTVYVILSGIAETTYNWSAWTLYSAALITVLVSVDQSSPRPLPIGLRHYPLPWQKSSNH